MLQLGRRVGRAVQRVFAYDEGAGVGRALIRVKEGYQRRTASYALTVRGFSYVLGVSRKE